MSDMVMTKRERFSVAKLQGLLLPVAAISMVFVMLIPVPGFVLDLLLAMSITASVIVFLTAVQVRRAVDLSVFPTLLLLLTLFRLSLNLASSRRILLHGHEGTHAAGERIVAAWAGQTDGLGKMRANGFEGLRGGPDAVLGGIKIGEKTEDAVAVSGPCGKGIEVGQVVSRMETSGAAAFFERAEAGEIEFPFSGVGWKKFAEELRCVLRVTL